MNRINLYPISFVEGGAVMVTEIAGAKLLSPYFGASIYCWASTLSITLLALMSGYYAGGYLTTKPRFQTAEKIVWIFLLSGIFVMLMPSLAQYIMAQTISLSFFAGLIFSQIFFLVTPIFLMAMISPMIIYQITRKAEESGKSAGSIYALSTSGGIVFTLLFGFFVIPEYGISGPVKILGLSIAMGALLLLVRHGITVKKLAIGATVLLLAAMALKHHAEPTLDKLTVLDCSEGLLGELKIVDQTGSTRDGHPVQLRSLRTNNVVQNQVLADNPTQSILYYVNFTKQVLMTLPERRSALLVGLGAGSMYKIMSDEYKSVETVELDKRIYNYGVQYFGMAAHDNVVDDGRHFINTCHDKFDMVMIDVIVGENVPEQMISEESFKKCRDLLTDNGVLIIENGAVRDFSHNSFAPSVVKTLMAAGFHVMMFNPTRQNNRGDIVYIASKNAIDYSKIYLKDAMTIKGGPIGDYAIGLDLFDLENAKLLTDDRNYTDKLLKAHYLTVRNELRQYLSQEIAYEKFYNQ